MFRLIMTRRDGSQFPLNWDIANGRLTDSAGERLPLPDGFAYAEPAVFCPAPATRPEAAPRKVRRVEKLRIQLGLKCNYACAYCMQALDRDSDIRQRTDDADAFLANLNQWLEGEPREIEFWGGEPLVYWKILKPLGEALRQRFPDATFRIITNGSLMDAGKVEWLDRLRFMVSISHDGPGQHLRGPDPLDDPDTRDAILLLWRSIGRRFSFLSVLSMASYSPAALVRFFIDRTGDDTIPVAMEGMVTPHDANGMMHAPMTEADHRQIRRILLDEFRMPAVFSRSLAFSSLTAMIQSLAKGLPSHARGQSCGMDRPGILAVTLDGHALVCQNVNQDKVIGSVHDFDAIRLTHSVSWHHRSECHACPVLASCGGSCMMVEGPERRVACDSAFTLGLARLALLLYVLTGTELVRIEGERIRFPGITRIDF